MNHLRSGEGASFKNSCGRELNVQMCKKEIPLSLSFNQHEKIELLLHEYLIGIPLVRRLKPFT
jgi:hypothetical protein